MYILLNATLRQAVIDQQNSKAANSCLHLTEKIFKPVHPSSSTLPDHAGSISGYLNKYNHHLYKII